MAYARAQDGAPPRDVLRRRVRVAEYYRIPYEEDIEKKFFAFYDESKDAWQKYSWHDLFSMSQIGEVDDSKGERNGRVLFDPVDDMDFEDDDYDNDSYMSRIFKTIPTKLPKYKVTKPVDFKISKDMWKAMKEENFEDSTTLYNPFGALANALERAENENPFVNSASFSDEKKKKILQACGVKVELRDDASRTEEYEKSMKEGRRNFSRYLKDWLIGNNIPYDVQVFLELFNWQGFDGNEGKMKDADAREAAFLALLRKVYNKKGGLPEIDASGGKKNIEAIEQDKWELVIIRPNIEHNMLGMVLGRGGLDELGATFWGQTELSCFDDSMHGDFLSA